MKNVDLPCRYLKMLSALGYTFLFWGKQRSVFLGMYIGEILPINIFDPCWPKIFSLKGVCLDIFGLYFFMILTHHLGPLQDRLKYLCILFLFRQDIRMFIMLNKLCGVHPFGKYMRGKFSERKKCGRTNLVTLSLSVWKEERRREGGR